MLDLLVKVTRKSPECHSGALQKPKKVFWGPKVSLSATEQSFCGCSYAVTDFICFILGYGCMQSCGLLNAYRTEQMFVNVSKCIHLCLCVVSECLNIITLRQNLFMSELNRQSWAKTEAVPGPPKFLLSPLVGLVIKNLQISYSFHGCLISFRYFSNTL